MKFKVREGFFIQLNETTRIPEKEIVELDAAGAMLHAHRIEGTDKESGDFMDSLVLKNAQPQPVGLTPETTAAIAAAVQAAVSAALGAKAAVK